MSNVKVQNLGSLENRKTSAERRGATFPEIEVENQETPHIEND